ncbi:LacI family DNA-binding transcriptional regulator [Actinospica durhamensis]|uniref:LacI family DNA-binding transcriptional regulator n=1 Tax=Actinospica durhamensis TaxID=1508375 RepID=A0A941EYX1_9ACTN|nr:LacI family DNA-binding transcriptional regulator [Actinospica durhamensis]MBR7837654.1 LacI family DNA-binding transcriptional regulator [Actinospica durhamensis]
MAISDAQRTALPTLEDVARAAGVSRATVSRVVNGAPSVSPELQRVVQDAIAAVGYVPNRAARQLITRRSGVIALVMSIAPGSAADASALDAGAPDDAVLRDPAPDGAASEDASPDASADTAVDRVFADPFFGRIVAGVLGFLRPLHLHPLLMLAEDEASRALVLDHLRQGAADGALVVSIDPADPLPGLLVQAGLPAVFFARPERPLPVRYVDLAHQDGGRLAAERLLAQGRRQVAAIAGPLSLHAGRARLDGFCDTMARHGVAYVPYTVGNFTQDSGERAMRELLEREPELDGVFAANDLMAVGALHVLRERGRRVPQDVAVIGFDDSSAAASARPRLTTVRQPVEAMAARMAQLLLERLDEPDSPPRAVLFDTELVVRASG